MTPQDLNGAAYVCLLALSLNFFVRVGHETKSVSIGNKHSFIYRQTLPKFGNHLFSKRSYNLSIRNPLHKQSEKARVLLLATVVSCPTRTKNLGPYLVRMSYASFVLISFLFVLEGKWNVRDAFAPRPKGHSHFKRH